MRFLDLVAVAVAIAVSTAGYAQSSRDPAATLRDFQPRASIPDRSVTTRPPREAMPSPDGTPAVFVGAVRIAGADVIDRSAFAPVIADYIGKDADATALQSLARAVATVARARGYVFASAMVPKQTIAAGTVTVVVEPGAVAQIRVSGSKNTLLFKILGKLVGPALQKPLLERQLLLAGDIPGIAVIGTRYVREGATGVLIVDIRENPVLGYVGFDTYGTRDLDPLRARVRGEWNGVLGEDDSLIVQAIGTPAAPSRLGYVSARYARQIGTRGVQGGVVAAIGRTRPLTRPGDGVYSATSRYLALFASAPLTRTNRASMWANGEVAVLRVVGGYDGIADQRDAVATVSLSLYGTMRAGNGRVSGAIGAVQGLPFAGVTRMNDPSSSRPDGDAVFSKAVAWIDYSVPLRAGFGLKLASNAQLAARPLLSSQEVGLGGPTSSRAYDFSERFGDSGVMGAAELGWRKVKPRKGIDWVQPYAFVDGGYVWNLADGFGDGALVSAGAGVRIAVGRSDFSLEAAAPISDARSDTGKRSIRLNLSFGLRF